jgi:hypothetical protein
MDEEIRELQELTDATEIGKRVTEHLRKTDEWSLELTRLRREAVDNLLRRGASHADVAAAIGLSRGRIGQIAKTGPAPERAFLGDGRLTIVVGQKSVHGNHNIEGPGVALETLNAHDRLKELAGGYQLETVREEIPKPGFFDLNRSNLIVMAGPRLFPMVGQILAGDTDLRFEADADGEWSLRDLNTDEVYRPTPRDANNHPIGDGPARDFGYLGRLPRPDGQGTFLCLAGIHATGTQGAAAHIEAALPQLYAETKTRRFSMVIECEYDPENDNIVTAAKPASPIYKRS